MIPDPADGRVFATERIVRTTDAAPDGRLRLDAVARYLQEAAEDDIADSGWGEPCAWLLRKCALAVAGFPRLGERVSLRTFCSALGPRWAERTTTLSAPGGGAIQARAVWVAVDPATGAPAALGPRFREIYGPSAQGRAVSARLSHPGPDPLSPGRPWPLRACDFDAAGHVNNTVHWAAVEDALTGSGWLPGSAEIEYHQPVLPSCEPLLVSRLSPAALNVWLVNGGTRLASARLAR